MNLNTLANTELFRLYVENGSKEAINVFFQNQMDLFYRVAYKYTKNAADAEDVLQSAFLSIMDTAYQYKGLQTDEEKLLQSWCLSVVVHCALMKIRSESSRRKREEGYSNTKTFQEDDNMETNSENAAIHKKIQDAIIQLPEKYRIPIHLKYVEGFELDAIANILKLNANTLRSIIKRGLEKVSDQLKAENVTLSSVGLIGLIEGMPIEKAPFAYQSIATKMLGAANSSKRVLMKTSPKVTLLSIKVILPFVLAGVAIIGGFYSWDKFNLKNNSTDSTKPLAVKSKEESVDIKYTNQVWDFSKEADRNLPLADGKWQWSDTIKGMQAKINSVILISLPIVPQNKAFMIEFELIADQNKEEMHKINFNAFWIRDGYMIKHDYFASKDIYKINIGAIENKFKIYCYNGYLCNFIGGKCYQLNKYSQNLDGSNLSVATQNFIFRKISSRTFEVPPDELVNAIKDTSNQTSFSHEAHKIGTLVSKKKN